jgi:hypothetical protein
VAIALFARRADLARAPTRRLNRKRVCPFLMRVEFQIAAMPPSSQDLEVALRNKENQGAERKHGYSRLRPRQTRSEAWRLAWNQNSLSGPLSLFLTPHEECFCVVYSSECHVILLYNEAHLSGADPVESFKI